MTQITDDDKDRIRKEFREEFGEYLRLKREYKNIALKEASEFIDVKESTLSRYESGEQDMKISNLPLLSLYYGFSMKACLSALHTNDTINNFSELVMIKRRKYQRKDIIYDKDEKLIAKIYTDRSGREFKVPVSDKRQTEYSYREKLARGEISFEGVEAFSPDEFFDYLLKIFGEEGLELLNDSATVINYADEKSKKETLKTYLADFVIDNIIVEQILYHDSEAARRAYMYYKRILELKDKE